MTPRSHDRRKAFSVTQVPSGDNPQGYLYVVLQGEQYESAEQLVQESYVLRLSAWAVIGSLGFGLFAGLLLFHLLTRRLQRLATIMETFQRSDFTHHQPYAAKSRLAGDEIESLGEAFDGMAERIISQLNELKDQDRLRRELVAQVSHDLRTPLAALHGYLETMIMKDTALNSGQKKEYLAIALRQSNRLTQMVEELFELAHLEARDAQPQYESCALGELLQDVTQKFQLHTEKNNLQLSMAPPPAMPLITTDIAMAERLLDNLISNAIDHTPNGGAITLGIILENNEITVSVSDTGPGIPAADLPHIFSPFYRGSAQAGNQGHAGLGLAIVKRIAELLQGKLKVVNNPEGGAIFTFSLPVALPDSHRPTIR